MPGLFGILDLNPAATTAKEGNVVFTKMADILRHHEEDQVEQAYILGSNLMVGRVGLPGRNPLEWPIRPDGTGSGMQLFVSGPLLERDTNGPIHGIPHITALGRWRGLFSAVLTKPDDATTLLVVDRRASIPIYYVETKDHLLFAPEVKALLLSLTEKEIDLEALATYLAQGYLHADQTLFQSVKRLRGGELLKVKDGKLVKETYWQFAPGSVPDSASQADLEHELGQLLNAAVRKHMGGPEKTVIFLSGGLDSRGILGAALANVHGEGERLNTVTMGVGQRMMNSDVTVAASVARKLNTNHRFVQRKITDYRENMTRVNYLIDGLSDVAAFHSCEYPIMTELHNSGYERALFGNEVFGNSMSASTIELAQRLQGMRRLREVQGIASIIQRPWYKKLCEASDAAVESALLEGRDLSPNQTQDFLYFSRRLQTWGQVNDYYKQIELDYRSPLLDDGILDFMAKVPDPMRVDKWLFRKVFTREYPSLAQLPFAKRRDLEDWPKLLATKTPVREYALEELNDRSSGIWEFLDPVALTKRLEAIERGSGFRSKPRDLLKLSLAIYAPGVLAYVREQRRTHSVVYLEVHVVILRSLALKNWYDTFV